MVLGRTADTGPVSKRWKGGLRGLVHPPADLRLERAATALFHGPVAAERDPCAGLDATSAMNDEVKVAWCVVS